MSSHLHRPPHKVALPRLVVPLVLPLIAIDAQGGPAVVGRRKERKLFRDAVAGHARSGGVVEEVDAVAESVVWGTRATCLAAEHTGDERRVGKECRSRWSPYH